MDLEKVKEKSVWIFIILGILIAITSALENHWEWLASLCGSFSSGCKEVRVFTFLTFPIAYWGIVFYLLLIAINAFFKTLRFWVVMAAMGVEFTFLWIMYSLDMPCLFCILNGIVMLFLFILLLDRKMIWQTLAVCSISFLAFNFILTQENRQVVQAAGEPKSVQDQNNSNHDSASNKAALPAASDQKKAVADKNSSPKLDFSIENSPSYGPSEADVVIVEFSDYMCPACRSLHPTTRLMREFFKDKVKWVFKDFPLQQHEGADQLAEAARCAWEQNKFWEFQDELFNLDQPVDFSLIPAIAQELGLDMPQFIECVESRKYMFEVIQDKQEALQNNINSTPSVFLNGHKIEKVRTREEFKQIIEKELANQMG